MIGVKAFSGCSRLDKVCLSNGLEKIGSEAFLNCSSLRFIDIPSTVKDIHPGVFFNCRGLAKVDFCDNIEHECTRLESVDLGEGLERVADSMFRGCANLQSINIPSRIISIETESFMGCASLKYVNLHEGLEVIGKRAFANCPSIQSIYIPSTVKEIHPNAFVESSQLTIRFCDEIEEFASNESLRDWMNNGDSRRTLRTYNFLIRCNVPTRLSMLTVRGSHAKIRNMLALLPSVDLDDSLHAFEDDEVNSVHDHLDHYFDIIDSKLLIYSDVISLLELAIWKSSLLGQVDPATDNLAAIMKKRKQCRDSCGACIIIPKVLGFLLTTELLHIMESVWE